MEVLLDLIEAFQYDYIIRALIASVMVGIMCGVIGCFIVLRNMALIGDALSHAVLPGVVVGFIIAGHSLFAFFTGAVIAGFIAAVLITWLQRNLPTKNDAAIGIVFTGMFSLGVIGISWLTRQEGVHLDLKDFLFGNVLGISNQDLLLEGLILVFVLACVLSFYRYLMISTFQPKIAQVMGVSVDVIHYFLMLLLSIVVVAALQSVGVILVVAMLIIPASTAYLLTNRLQQMILIAGSVGALSAIGGLILAILFDTTPGPAMTIFGSFFYLGASLFSTKSGVLVKWWRKRQLQRQILSEDALKAMVKLRDSGENNIEAIAKHLGLSAQKVSTLMTGLAKRSLVEVKGNQVKITSKGLSFAYEMIRKHRLWETYLVERVGLGADQIHDEAERMEHLLTDEFIKSVEERLGHPLTDPHGSPIPQQVGKDAMHLSDLNVGDLAATITNQEEGIISSLWEQGVGPNSWFKCLDKDEKGVHIEFNGNTIILEDTLANQVIVVKK